MDGTARWDEGLLPPPPCPVPEGVQRVARAMGLRQPATQTLPSFSFNLPDYEILGELGRGGMGVVYRARHRRLHREVALKMVLHGPHASPRELERLRLEAESIARLQHPHIVQIFEVGETNGCPYCALEYVDGGSLADQIHGTPQPHGAAVECVMALCQAIAYAHQRGILHRDLKPSNVLLTRERVPKVTDFGLAKQYATTDVSVASETSPSARSQSQIVGTPSYMAPELLRCGKRSPQVTMDVYGLGAILYELLTGRPPFRAESPQETLVQVLLDDPVPPIRLQPKLPRDLDTICLKCLAKQPDRRYATVDALQHDLRCFLEGKPISARPIGVAERGLKWARRRPAGAARQAGIVLTVATLLCVGWGVAMRERQQAALLREERNRAIHERNEKTLFLEKSLAAEQQLKELADAMATLPEGQLRRRLQEERLKIYLEAVSRASDDLLISREQARTYQRLADIYRNLKKPGEALDAQRSANQIFACLIQAAPRNEEYEGDYVIGLDRLGLLLKQNQEFSEAEQTLRDGIARAEQLLTRSPRTARYHGTLGTMLNNLATYLYDLDDRAQLEQACEMLEQAIDHQRQAVALDSSPLYTMFLRNHHGALAEALLRKGDYERAADRARVLPTFFPDDPLDYKRAADFLDRCSRAAAADTSLEAAERERRSTRYAEEAASLRDQARQRGDRART
jgi:tRNA A-37 threonylcarbamoyl transferase component Bud32/tetratricopeptide (TPR) repeat protein